MDFSHADIKSLGKRLDFTAETLKCALSASSIFHDLDSFEKLRPSQCVERLENLPDEAIIAVSKSILHGSPREKLETYLAKWKHVKAHITGNDLKARGLSPGPKYKEILRRLRAAWLDGEVDSKDEELQLLNDLLQ
jgi:tRNA nucleotidyltransferase (CCA-adding enzyme)